MEIIKRASVYIFVFLLTTVLLFLFLWNRKKHLEDAYLLQKTQKVEAEFRAALSSYDKLVSFFFKRFLSNENIQEIIYKASIDKKNFPVYRKQLYDLLKDVYADLKTYNIKYLHFYFPDGTSFIRFHKLEKYGDKIKFIKETKNKTAGGFRYIYPIFYEKLLVGNAEIVIPFGTIRDDLNRLFNSEHIFLVKKEFVFNRLFLEERKNYIESDLSKDFFYEASLNSKGVSRIPEEIISQINKKIREEASSLLKKKKPFYFATKVKGDFYTVSFIPVYAVKHLKKMYIGYLVTYEKDNSVGIYTSSFWVSFGAVSTIIFLFLLSAFAVSYIKEKIFIEEAEEIDELTEAYNEKTFISLLSSELARAKRYDRPLSIMVIDFPFLKELPEEKRYESLKSLAGIIMENIRDTDYIAHIDDTQLAILAPETNIEEIKNLGERIKDILEHTHLENAKKPTFYIGITEASFSDNVETLLKRVKEALYLAQEKNSPIETAS